MLDPDACYAAVVSRDARFDGRFFTAVLTTGIYCRPVCPARTPLRPNVRFFSCAAAAEDAGFRPCLRCRPEAAPGTARWRTVPPVVSRALRLIDAGALDEGGVPELAARVGVGDRQLRRLIKDHVGATPVALAQVRRVQFAKALIDETQLSMAEIAFAAGFSSIRRFNDAFRASYQAPPSAIRRRERREAPAAATITLTLAARPPLDVAAVLAWLAPRAIPGVEAVGAGGYRRWVGSGEAGGILEARPLRRGTGIALTLPASLGRELLPVVGRARRLFDLGADPAAISAHLATSPALAEAVGRRPGMRIPGAFDGFEVAVRAILGQQVSVAGATTLAGRLVERWGDAIPGDEAIRRRFPSPPVLADAEVQAIGMPQRRGEAIRAVAALVHRGALRLEPGADADEARARLTAIPGIGPWTAHYISMRCLGDPDAFPAGDLILRRAAAPPGEALTERQLRDAAEPWRPWRAYAAMHLWALAGDRAAGDTQPS